MGCINDTDSIALDVNGGVLTADARVDPAGSNVLEVRAGGIYVPEQNPDAWFVTDEVWTWATTDDTPTGVGTYTITAAGDFRSRYSVGMRFRATQLTDKFFLITDIAYDGGGGFTTLTLFGGTDYSLTNASITAVAYSSSKIPFGFPATPEKWGLGAVDSTDLEQANANQNQWYNPGGLGLTLPIGVWDVWYEIAVGVDTGGKAIEVSFSTAAANESDDEWRTVRHNNSAFLYTTTNKRRIVTMTAKTPHYAIIRNASGNGNKIGFYGLTYHPSIIRAYCAYL